MVAAQLILLAGCAGPATQLSRARIDATAHNERGVADHGKGDFDGALEEFSEALRINSSIENGDGMIVALVNIARTQRLKGDIAAAGEAVDRARTLLQEPSDLQSEVLFEKAKIVLAGGDLAAAKEWALAAEGAERGGAKGQRANLVALILMRQGLRDQARVQAERALQLNADEEMTLEEANSFRLLGEIYLGQGELDKSADSFQRALTFDKELGVARKIAADLRGLGGVLAKKGDKAGAISLYKRAMQVSLNGGDTKSASGDKERLAELER